MRTLRILTLFALLPGCMGTPDVVGGGNSGLVEVQLDVEPLAPVEDELWHSAPAGCEGLLMGELTFKVASADDHLVAAFDGEGSIVCVDTVDAVQEELEEQGEEERADELGDQFLLAARIDDVPNSEDYAAGDPTPQPSLDGTDGDEHDPSPQPSMQPRR